MARAVTYVSLITRYSLLLLLLAGCTFGFDPNADLPAGESGRVVFIVDGDTIDVNLNGQTVRVRYIGVNTPERGEACYDLATAANRALVEGKIVRLEKDVSETDRFGRLLRYVYVDDLLVNRALVEQGYAEAVSYPPDVARFDEFRELERQAKEGNRGCHPTGIFDDGSDTR
jgi:micrococcal nuclease